MVHQRLGPGRNLVCYVLITNPGSLYSGLIAATPGVLGVTTLGSPMTTCIGRGLFGDNIGSVYKSTTSVGVVYHPK